MTCIGTSKLNGLMLIPLALARTAKLYCPAAMAVQKVGRSVEGSVIGNRTVALHFLVEWRVETERQLPWESNSGHHLCFSIVT